MTNLYRLFSEQVNSERCFIRSALGDTLFTYNDLDRISAEFAAGFIQLGLKPGDRVMVQVEKSP